MTMTMTDRDISVPAPLQVGLLAGLAAGVVELVAVFVLQGLMGVSATRVLQAIASGLLGASAYKGGNAVAWLGLLIHVAISIVGGVVFALAASRWPVLLERSLVSSVAYGTLVYLLMSRVVLPLSAAAFPVSNEPILVVASVASHILAFALPIVMLTRRMYLVSGSRRRTNGVA